MEKEVFHVRISLENPWNEDKYRDLTVMGPFDGDERPEVRLGVSSLGMSFDVALTPDLARQVAAALLEAAGPEAATLPAAPLKEVP